VFRAIAARHPRFQEALVLEEVQMPPSLDAGVMRRTKLAAQRTSKAFALFKNNRRGSPSNRHSWGR
jgi:hypothetical protein